MSTILTRYLDANGDPLRGNGLQNFASDIQAVAIVLSQRLQLLQGEWFLKLSDGLPLFQSILGVPSTSASVSLILRRRILGTPGITGILTLLVNYPRVNTYSRSLKMSKGGFDASSSISSETNFDLIGTYVQSAPSPQPRSYVVAAVVSTQFGPLALTNNPTSAPGVSWQSLGGGWSVSVSSDSSGSLRQRVDTPSGRKGRPL